MERPFVQWIGSATELERLPAVTVPEVAFVGRSNVGKSSVINALAQQSVARVSQTPGRTRAIHVMDVRFASTKNPVEMRLIDLPGYGYAKVSKSISSQWPELIHPYLQERPALAMCVVLVDAGLPPQPKDIQMVDWLKSVQRPFMVVAAKSDKPKRNQLLASLAVHKAQYAVEPLAVSARTGDQIPELWRVIRQVCRDFRP